MRLRFYSPFVAKKFSNRIPNFDFSPHLYKLGFFSFCVTSYAMYAMAQMQKKSIEEQYYVHPEDHQAHFNHFQSAAPNPVPVNAHAVGFNTPLSSLKQAIDIEDQKSLNALLNQYEAVLSTNDKNDLMVYAHLSGKKESLLKLVNYFQFEPDYLSRINPFDTDYLNVYSCPSKKDITPKQRLSILSGKAIFLFRRTDPDEFTSHVCVLYKSRRDGNIKESLIGKQFSDLLDQIPSCLEERDCRYDLASTKAILKIVAAFDGVTYVSSSRIGKKVIFKNPEIFLMMLTEAVQTNNLLLVDDLFRAVLRPEIAVKQWDHLIGICTESGKIRLLERFSQQVSHCVARNKRAKALLARSDKDNFELMSRTFDKLEHVDFQGVALLLSMLSSQFSQKVDRVIDDPNRPPVALLRGDYRCLPVREKVARAENEFTKLSYLIYAHFDNFSGGYAWEETVMSSGLTPQEQKLVEEAKAIFLIREPEKRAVTIVFKPHDKADQSVSTRVVKEHEIHDDEAFERNMKLTQLVWDSNGIAFTSNRDFNHFLESVKKLSDKKATVKCGFILQGCHTISGQIFVRDGRATLFLFDSLGVKTPWAYEELGKVVKNYFPDTHTYASKVALQHDGVGCNLFSLVNVIGLSHVEDILGFNPVYGPVPKGERLLAYARNNVVESENGMDSFIQPLCLALTKQGLSRAEKSQFPLYKQGLLYLTDHYTSWQRERDLPCDMSGCNTLDDYLERSRFIDRDLATGKKTNRTVNIYLSMWGPRVVDWALRQEPEVLTTLKTPAFAFK